MTERQQAAPVSIPEGHACLCNVPPGHMHTDECMRLFVIPRGRKAQQRRDRIEHCRNEVIKAAIEWERECSSDPMPGVLEAMEICTRLEDAVKALRWAEGRTGR